MPANPAPRDWSPTSWTAHPAEQQPVYRDRAALERVVAEMSRLPPTVVSWEVDDLRRQIADAQQGRAVPAAGRRLRGDASPTASRGRSRAS